MNCWITISLVLGDRPGVSADERRAAEHMGKKGFRHLLAVRNTIFLWAVGLTLGGLLGYIGYKSSLHDETVVASVR
jgi:hypothetical protein